MDTLKKKHDFAIVLISYSVCDTFHFLSAFSLVKNLQLRNQRTLQIFAISKIQLVVYYQCFLAAKKGLKSSLNELKLFCLDIFDQLVRPHGLPTQPIRARGIIVNHCEISG